MQLSLKGDENEDDKQPGDDHINVYEQKLNSLNKILNDVYPPAESYKINEKLMKMGRIPVFVSFFFWTCHLDVDYCMTSSFSFIFF